MVWGSNLTKYSYLVCDGIDCRYTDCKRYYKNGHCMDPGVSIKSDQCIDSEYRYYENVIKDES